MVKVVVCLRLLGHARLLRDMDDSEQMLKETIRKFSNSSARMSLQSTVLYL